ncbi:MAG: hypothetical protein RBG13Loki_3680 [Promethearchaeota archaeon CR_4]|nr:MAG: hypothetical protein RBG13Loki_3680 [Candidatus Lokiarchaeota archaeon CR_4]
MEARNLWRVRLSLFVLIFFITILIPTYTRTQIFSDEIHINWLFVWGGSSLFSEEQFLETVLQFLFQMIVPSLLLTIGIRGCILTKRSKIVSEKNSKTARILTQISVTGFLFSAITSILYSGLNSLLDMSLSLQYSISYSYFSLNIAALCILPITLFLAYISYDFPRFHASDFALENSTTEQTPEEVKTPPTRGVPQRNLWRLRLVLFSLVFLITILVPAYLKLFENAYLEFFGWQYCINCASTSFSITFQQILFIMLVGLIHIIIPCLLLVTGVIGCLLTGRTMKSGGKISKTARIWTQMGVTASLISTIYGVVSSFWRMIYYLIWDFFYLYFDIAVFCVLPVILYLGFISYDFPRFRARDFLQETSAPEPVPEESTFPPAS